MASFTPLLYLFATSSHKRCLATNSGTSALHIARLHRDGSRFDESFQRHLNMRAARPKMPLFLAVRVDRMVL